MKNNDEKKIFSVIGASNHCAGERAADDYYATDPDALQKLLELEDFSHYIWEPACGGGHLCDVLKEKGYEVRASDIKDRGYPGTEIIDFLTVGKERTGAYRRDIITNPPYSKALEFIEHALDISDEGTKIAFFLKLQFLEGSKRKKFFEDSPPKKIYVSSSRIKCAINGDFDSITSSSAIAYAWFIWEKGYKGEPCVKWFN